MEEKEKFTFTEYQAYNKLKGIYEREEQQQEAVKPIVPATKQELDAVMSQLYPGLKNNDTPTADKSDYQKVIDEAIKNM